MTVVKTAYKFCSSFEGELLLELMLKYWKHPLCDESDFRNQLLESAAEALRASIGGETLFESIPPDQVNFVAAVYYAESAFVQSPSAEGANEQLAERVRWLEVIRRTVPSCFCDQGSLFD